MRHKTAAAALLALLLFAAAAIQCARPAAARPNFVVILVDDLGYRDVGFNGATEIRTPNIDRIARDGAVFTNGYVTSPICTPSRGGLLTGRYPARFGLDANLAYAPNDPHLGLPIEEATIADYLRGAGYRTGLVGKWQLGAAPGFLPRERGFDYFFGFLGGSHYYWGADYDAGSPALEFRTPLVENRAVYPSKDDEYLTDVLGDKAAEFIRQPAGEPFLLYLAYNAPHWPIQGQGPPELVAKYAGVADETRREYLAMVDALDRSVGRVLDALDEWGVRDNTVVFLLSDNGGVWRDADYADNGPLRRGKDSIYEGGIRVPFAAAWPGQWPAGISYDSMVISLDITATALALAGVRAAGELDGVNLDPFLRGRPGEPHETLYWRDDKDYAVRSGDWKLVKRRNAPPELFNLREDIGETRNLIGEQPEAAARLAGLWNQWNQENIPSYFPSILGYERQVAAMLDERDAEARGGAGGAAARLRLEPPAPSGLAARGGVGVITLTWDAPEGGEVTGYQIRSRAAGAPAWSEWRDLAPSDGSGVAQYTLRGLDIGAAYRVQLRAVNPFGSGAVAEAAAAPPSP